MILAFERALQLLNLRDGRLSTARAVIFVAAVLLRSVPVLVVRVTTLRRLLALIVLENQKKHGLRCG